MSSEVRITSGETGLFAFGTTQTTSITANQVSLPMYKKSPWSTFQAVCYSTTFGALTATVNIQGSNDIWTGVGFVVNNCVITSGSAAVTSNRNEFAGGSEQLNDLFNPAVAVGMKEVPDK